MTELTTLEEEFGRRWRKYREQRESPYPMVVYQRRILDYIRDVLHVTVVTPWQARILLAVQAAILGEGCPRIAVRSGQKSGKTKLVIWVALWFRDCFEDAHTYVMAAIEAQTKLVLWGELGNTLRIAMKKGYVVDGKLAASPAGGFISEDGARFVKGITGRDIESLAGVSTSTGRQLFIVDEASALPEAKAEVLDGNSLGGGVLLWISNPTRNDGPFFEAFKSRALKHGADWRRGGWVGFHVDGEDVVAWQERTGTFVKGLVTREGIEAAEAMYGGKDSPFYVLRVKGDFLTNETGRAFPMSLIEEASLRNPSTDAEGWLSIGYDCAGPGDGGDEHCWYMTRGRKSVDLVVKRGRTIDEAVDDTLEVLAMYRRPGETPRVVVDSSGPIGSVIFARLHDVVYQRKKAGLASELFEVTGVNGGLPLFRTSKFVRVRDQLIWTAAQWLKQGGGLLQDHMLQRECNAQEWISKPNDQLLAKDKKAIRRELARSPDRFDAFCLSVFVPVEEQGEEDPAPRMQARSVDFDAFETIQDRGDSFDPYSANSAFEGGRDYDG